MNERERVLCERLRAMESAEAAEWLISEYPMGSKNWGEALVLIPYRSWGKPEQWSLAQHYFGKVLYANAKPYEVFAQSMPPSRMAQVLDEFIPPSEPDKQLLLYHLYKVLANSNMASQSASVEVIALLAKLGVSASNNLLQARRP